MLKAECLTRRGMLLLCVSLLAACSSLLPILVRVREMLLLWGNSRLQPKCRRWELIDVNGAVAQSLYQAQVNQSFAQLGDGHHQ